MSNPQRISTVIGVLFLGVAAYIVAVDRKAMKQLQKARTAPPVEELGEKLKEAWAGHHIA